jgi:hypothetical protein
MDHHLEKPPWPKVQVFKLTQCSLWNHVLDTAASKIGGSLWKDTCIPSTQLNRPLSTQQSVCPPWHTYGAEKYSSQKLTQFSQCNNVLHAPATQYNGFLSRDTCISSTQLNRPISIKMSFSPPWNLWFCRHYSFQTLFQLSQWNNGLDTTGCNMGSFFVEMRVFLQISWIDLM